MFREAAVLCFLGVNAWSDRKRREISLVSLLVFGGAGILWRIRFPWESIGNRFVSLLPGLLFLGAALCTGGKIGIGDGLAVLVTGCFLSLEEGFRMILLAFAGVPVYCGICRLRGDGTVPEEIPFLPFLFWGYLGGLWL